MTKVFRIDKEGASCDPEVLVFVDFRSVDAYLGLYACLSISLI